MKIGTTGIYALGILLIVGCDQLEEVVDLGRRSQDETRREEARQSQEQQQAEERKTSLQAERDSLRALICGKQVVLTNRIAETEAAIRALQADRAAFSKELGATIGGDRAINGAGLERALASPVVNGLAMKYLKMDFSVARGEYVELIAKARENDAELKREIKKLDQTFDGLLDLNPQVRPAARRASTIADLQREYGKLERKKVRLTRMPIPTGNVYRYQKEEHDRELRLIEARQQAIERMIDQLKTGDERGRKEAEQIAARTRERALNERNTAVEKLKAEYEKKASVLKTVQTYNEKTLRRLEQALVKEAMTLDEKLRKSREGCLTLQGIEASVPKLSTEGLKKVQGQVSAL